MRLLLLKMCVNENRVTERCILLTSLRAGLLCPQTESVAFCTGETSGYKWRMSILSGYAFYSLAREPVFLCRL